MHTARGHYPWYVASSQLYSSSDHVYMTALESAHAVWEAVRIAKTLPQDQDIVLVSTSCFRRAARASLSSQCLSGRGDKDVEQISQLLPGKWADILDWHVSATK
jgi:tryptophan synthase